MDDRFLNELRREPRPEFARSLRAKLRQAEERQEREGFRFTPALAGAFALVVVASLFLFPSVRASAQAFLEMFRVRQFTAVQFDPARLDRLRALKNHDNAMLVFDKKEVLRDPGPRRDFATLEEAAAAAGIIPRRVTQLPSGLLPDSAAVEGEGEMRLTLNGANLRLLLDDLGLNDVRVPDGFDGQPIHVRKSAVVFQRLRGGSSKAIFVQSRCPEVGLPAGANLEQLGEVGLRVLGLDAAEARRVASSVDWRTTLVVPVPLNGSTFRPVTINGNNGLLVNSTGEPGADGQRHREGSLVLWSDGDQMFALEGNLRGPELVLMAESVQ
jgi:hypothetical protein